MIFTGKGKDDRSRDSFYMVSDSDRFNFSGSGFLFAERESAVLRDGLVCWPEEIIHIGDRKRFLRERKDFLESRRVRESFTYRCCRKGFVVKITETILVNRDEAGKITCSAGFIKERSGLLSTDEEFRDPVTMLPDRSAFYHNFADYDFVSGDSAGAFVLAGIDNFRMINSSEGYEFGNCVLLRLATHFEQILPGEWEIYRWLGDTFVFHVPGVRNEGDLRKALAEISKNMRQPLYVSGKKAFVTCSFGAVFFPENGDDFSELMKNCELSLYEAKKTLKSSVFFYNDRLTEKINAKASVDNLLRNALKEDLFEVVYQPVYDISRGCISGMEALLRLIGSEGDVETLTMIELAEETGLIVRISDYVLTEVCGFAAELAKQGLDYSVAVNLSGLQFSDPSLSGTIRRILAESGISPEMLKLEITESTLMRDFHGASDFIREFSDKGIKFLIDDFGTGYSSFAYLNNLPVDVLKIDGSFVRNIGENEKERTILSYMIRMAHEVGLEVIAEGVETEEQISFLLENGVEGVQGFFCSPPLGKAEMLELLIRQDGTPAK